MQTCRLQPSTERVTCSVAGGLKARLTQENFELQRQIQDIDSSNAILSKAKSSLQVQLDDAKSRLDEESRVRSQLTVQITNLQVRPLTHSP